MGAIEVRRQVISMWLLALLVVSGVVMGVIAYVIWQTLTHPSGGNINLQGLVGYWKFDEGSGTNALDSSGNSNHGTLVNGPSWVDGINGKALYFDGADDYVDCAEASSFDITNAITIEAWIYKESNLAHGGTVLGKWEPDLNGAYVLYGDGDNAGGFGLVWPGNSKTNADGYSVPLNSWVHYVATYDGSRMRVYVNGTLVKEVSDNRAIATTDTELWIGNDGYSQHFSGMIDDVRLYNRALTPEEVQEHYESLSP